MNIARGYVFLIYMIFIYVEGQGERGKVYRGQGAAGA